MGDTVGIDFTGNTTVATDEVGGVHFQLVKLVSGEADSAARIHGDATNGLDVDVTRVSGTVAASMLQNVTADANNSSSTNLDTPSYTFTGAASSTLGVAGIQVSLYADKNCKVQVQQSPNGTAWDLTDTFYYTAAGNFGTTVQAVSSYVRVVVSTNAETTTAFRLQTALCPIVEAVPRALSPVGAFKVAPPLDDLTFQALNTPMGELRTATPLRLVGAIFEGSTIDARFWTTAASGTSATIAQAASQIVLTTGTSSGATVTMFSVRRARYVAGHAIRYRAAVQVSAGIANNVKRWGVGWGASMPTVTDGAWFRMNGTTLDLQVAKGPSTVTTISSFNGYLGATYDPSTTVHTYEIYWTNAKIYFVIDGALLHTHSAAAATWANTKTFHVFADTVNSDVVTSSTLSIRTAAIHRFGPETTTPQYYNLTGNAATHVLKLGAGTLRRLIFNNTSGTSFIIYDNTTNSAPIIGTVTTAAGCIGSWNYDMPFFNGLTITTTGNGLDLTVVYE